MSPYLRLLRPKQWIKNGFVVAPIFFSQSFMDVDAWLVTLLATIGFLSVSCVVYIVNDMRDMDEDRIHPVKCHRPLAAGEIRLMHAAMLAIVIAGSGFYVMSQLPIECMIVAGLYLLFNGVYTVWLKHIALLDIFFIAICYVLRVLMGCYALQIFVSPWIILTTFLLALFLGFGKRHHEIGFDDYVKKKANLQHYSRDLLDRLVVISGGSALMSYAIYTAEMATMLGRVEMVYTVIFVAFGLFRYLQMIYVYGQGGEPELVILKDKWQLINVMLWLITTLVIMF